MSNKLTVNLSGHSNEAANADTTALFLFVKKPLVYHVSRNCQLISSESPFAQSPFRTTAPCVIVAGVQKVRKLPPTFFVTFLAILAVGSMVTIRTFVALCGTTSDRRKRYLKRASRTGSVENLPARHAADAESSLLLH